jgi:hypothetical protein
VVPRRAPGTQRRVYGAGRATEEGDTLTVATAGRGSEALPWAASRIVLEPSSKPARGESWTLRAENLA